MSAEFTTSKQYQSAIHYRLTDYTDFLYAVKGGKHVKMCPDILSGKHAHFDQTGVYTRVAA